MLNRTIGVVGAGLILFSACGTSVPKPELDQVAEQAADKVADEATDAAGVPKITKVAAGDLEWKPGPDGEKFQVATPFKDENTGSTVMFIKFPAGWENGPHYHPTGFSRILIDGDFEVTYSDGSTFKAVPGDYLRAGANGIHWSKTSGGATMLVISDSAFGAVATDKEGKPVKEGDAAPGEVTEKPAFTAAADVQYMEVPNAGGIQMGRVYMNPETKAMAAFLKVPAGWKNTAHFHTTNFHRVVVDGAMTVTTPTGQAFPGAKGDYFRAEEGAVHTADSAEGATIFVVTDGEFGTVMLDESGNPIPKS